MSELILRNRQRRRRLDLRALRRIAEEFLRDRLRDRSYEIGLYIVAAQEMATLNQRYLRHTGSTDVITFQYAKLQDAGPLAGDIFVCMDDAIVQARHFSTPWQAELIRYFIHGVLHLQGYDDLQPAARRRMKREENKLLREVGKKFRMETITRQLRRRSTASPARRTRRGKAPKTLRKPARAS